MRPTQPSRDRTLSDDDPSRNVPTASFMGADSQDTTLAGKSDTVVPPVRASLEVPGQVARFQVLRRLGQGGFGAVYLARDPVLERDVALKLPCEGDGLSQDEVDRLVEEARIAARLKHPHVVTIYDVGRDDRSGVFIAMEYVEGESLAERLKRGRLSVDEAVRVCGQIADAIHHGHKLGLIHRDLKPGNVLLDRDGQVKVCDFGLALREESQASHRGDASGTRPYMSPEQIRGDVHLLDGRSDLWSLGIILYECLSGRRPYRGDTLAEIHEDILTRDPKPLNQFDDAIPVGLDELFRRCTRRDMAGRPRTGLEFKQALESVARSDSRPSTPRVARRTVVVAMCVLCVAALIVVAAYLSGLVDRAAEELDSDSGIVDMLAQPPVPVNFAFSDPNCNYSYMERGRRLTVDSQFWSMFRCGANAKDCQFDAVASFPTAPATAGVFWGLHPEPAADGSTVESCLAIVVAPTVGTPESAVIQCYRLVIGKNIVGDTAIISKTDLARSPATLDWKAPCDLRVRVVDGQPAVVLLQGRSIPLPPLETAMDWTAYISGQCGIVTKGPRVAFTRALQTSVEKER
jgi:hypothetical protein